MASSVSPHVPHLPRTRPGLFGIPGRRARPGWTTVGQSGGGGGVPPSFRGAVGGSRGAGGRPASVSSPASLGRVPKGASLALPSP